MGTMIAGIVHTINLHAIDVVVEVPSGEHIRFEASPEDTLENIFSVIESFGYEQEASSYTFTYLPCKDELLCKAAKVRDYNAPVPASIVKDIRYIILTLANQPLLKLKKYKDSLKTAGDRLDKIHPLNIWKEIFTDNEMIPAINNIKRRTTVWDNFMKGMGKSLDEAREVNDLKPEYIEDFCQKIGVKPSLILPFINANDWEGFVKQLINHVVRDGEPHRYDQ